MNKRHQVPFIKTMDRNIRGLQGCSSQLHAQSTRETEWAQGLVPGCLLLALRATCWLCSLHPSAASLGYVYSSSTWPRCGSCCHSEGWIHKPWCNHVAPINSACTQSSEAMKAWVHPMDLKGCIIWLGGPVRNMTWNNYKDLLIGK